MQTSIIFNYGNYSTKKYIITKFNDGACITVRAVNGNSNYTKVWGNQTKIGNYMSLLGTSTLTQFTRVYEFSLHL
jgi:hypothetical protein